MDRASGRKRGIENASSTYQIIIYMLISLQTLVIVLVIALIVQEDEPMPKFHQSATLAV